MSYLQHLTTLSKDLSFLQQAIDPEKLKFSGEIEAIQARDYITSKVIPMLPDGYTCMDQKTEELKKLNYEEGDLELIQVISLVPFRTTEQVGYYEVIGVNDFITRCKKSQQN